MPQITLADGSQRHFDHPITIAEIAADIGPGLAKAALAGKVNDRLVDTSYQIDADAEVAIVTDKDVAGLEVLRHSICAFISTSSKSIIPTSPGYYWPGN